MLPLQRWRESAAGPTTLQGQTTQQTHSPQMSCVVRSEAASCWQAQRSDYRPLISGSQVRALNCPSPPKLAVESLPAERPIFGRFFCDREGGSCVSPYRSRLLGTSWGACPRRQKSRSWRQVGLGTPPPPRMGGAPVTMHAMTMIPAGIAAWQSSGSVVFIPSYVSHLARACAKFGQFDDARRQINEAFKLIETTGERWRESDIHRTAGDIALLAPEPNVTQAETHFSRALATAREQQAKSDNFECSYQRCRRPPCTFGEWAVIRFLCFRAAASASRASRSAFNLSRFA
jgi:hypothetical protein